MNGDGWYLTLIYINYKYNDTRVMFVCYDTMHKKSIQDLNKGF